MISVALFEFFTIGFKERGQRELENSIQRKMNTWKETKVNTQLTILFYV